MNCFTHADRDAVGVCVRCGRGICSECVAVIGDSLCCRDRCEKHVQLVNLSTNDAMRTYERAAAQERYAGPVILAFGIIIMAIGVCLASFGKADSSYRGGTGFVLLGFVFAVMGAISIMRLSFRARARQKLELLADLKKAERMSVGKEKNA